MSTTLGDYLNKWQVNKYQQALLAPLPGKVARQEGILINFYLLMWLRKPYTPAQTGLPLCCLLFISYTG